MAHIFISYAREDEERIQPLVHALENEGWSIFWDRRIPAGQTWRSYIGKALSDAKCVIVVWSRNSLESGWVSEEADEGKKRNILIPVLLDSVEPPIGFRSIQAADLSDWQPENPSPHFEQLLHDVRSLLNDTPPLPSPSPRPPIPPQPKPWQPLGLSPRFIFSTFVAILLVLVAVVTYMYWPNDNRSSLLPPNSCPEPSKYQLYLHLGKPPERDIPSKDSVLQTLKAKGFLVKENNIDDKVDRYGPGVDYFHEGDRDCAALVAQTLNSLLQQKAKLFKPRPQSGRQEEETLGIWF